MSITEAFACISPSWGCCACPSPLSHREFYTVLVGLRGGTRQGGPSKGSALRQGAQGRPTSGTSHPGPPSSPTPFPARLGPPG